MRIFLVRHGNSEANRDKSILLHRPDHAVGLSDVGKEEAEENGRQLARYLEENPGTGNMRVWNSSYWRTRQTRDIFVEQLAKNGHKFDCRESPLLVEQQFGLFDGYEDEELMEKFPNEYQNYKKNHEQEGRYYARMPLGESRFDVSVRVHQFFGTLLRDYETKNIDDLVIVSHGVTIRAFVMMWLHRTPEWFDAEPNPGNCAIRLIEGDRGEYQDKNYVVGGISPKHHTGKKFGR